jgi:hypothetical protein
MRRVNNSGDISWHKGCVIVNKVFRNEEIGLEQMDETCIERFSASPKLGEFNSSRRGPGQQSALDENPKVVRRRAECRACTAGRIG